MEAQEYRGIKSEIISLSRIRIQLSILFLTVVSTFTGYLFTIDQSKLSNKVDYIVLILSLIFFTVSVFIELLRKHLRRLSTYLVVYFEEENKDKYQFETSWKKFRKSNSPWTFTWPISFFLTISILIAVGSLWYFHWSAISCIKCVSIFIIIFSLFVIWKSILLRAKEEKDEDEMLDKWQEIKDNNTNSSK